MLKTFGQITELLNYWTIPLRNSNNFLIDSNKLGLRNNYHVLLISN